MKLTKSKLKTIIREEVQFLTEAKRVTAQYTANIIKEALRRDGYFGKAYIKNVIVYKDAKDYERNVGNSWGGYSGDQVSLQRGIKLYSKPNAVFDIFIYSRGFGDYGDLESNTVVYLPSDREEEMVQVRSGEYMPLSMAIKEYGDKKFLKL